MGCGIKKHPLAHRQQTHKQTCRRARMWAPDLPGLGTRIPGTEEPTAWMSKIPGTLSSGPPRARNCVHFDLDHTRTSLMH